MSLHRLTYDSEKLTYGILYIYLDPWIKRTARVSLAIRLSNTEGGQFDRQMGSTERVCPGYKDERGLYMLSSVTP